LTAAYAALSQSHRPIRFGIFCGVMTVPAEKNHAPKWAHAVGVIVLLGGSTALCWLTIELLRWGLGPFDGNQHDWLLYDICLFLLWCVCFATVGELMNDWWEHRGWKP
jgi:hypothetical protein